MISNVKIRAGVADDASDISAMLQALVNAGKRNRPADQHFVQENYLSQGLVSSSVAEIDGAILGIQVLSIAGPANPFGVAEGDGVIGTHVHPDAGGQGLGRALLARTLDNARESGLTRLVAAIVSDNQEGLGYYAAMGFVHEREEAGRIYRVLTL